MPRNLLDDDGENRAVRCFLSTYSADRSITIGDMRGHMTRSGFGLCWPDWVQHADRSEHLTKAGAQHWLRYLFSMENMIP